MTSTDDITQSMDGIFIRMIFGENASVSVIRRLHPWMLSIDENSIQEWGYVVHGWRNVIRGCHPWMEKCHPWMSSMDGEVSSMDGEISSMDGSVIRGCHPWMPSMDEDDGHGRSLYLLVIRQTP